MNKQDKAQKKVRRYIKHCLAVINKTKVEQAASELEMFLAVAPRISLDQHGSATYSQPGERPGLPDLVARALSSGVAWDALHEIAKGDVQAGRQLSAELAGAAIKIKPPNKTGENPLLISARNRVLCRAVQLLRNAGFKLTQSADADEERSACAIVGRLAREHGAIRLKKTQGQAVSQAARDTANMYNIWKRKSPRHGAP